MTAALVDAALCVAASVIVFRRHGLLPRRRPDSLNSIAARVDAALAARHAS